MAKEDLERSTGPDFGDANHPDTCQWIADQICSRVTQLGEEFTSLHAFYAFDDVEWMNRFERVLENCGWTLVPTELMEQLVASQENPTTRVKLSGLKIRTPIAVGDVSVTTMHQL